MISAVASGCDRNGEWLTRGTTGRVLAAQARLMCAEIEADAVAAAFGAHFHRAFRARFGMTPGELRAVRQGVIRSNRRRPDAKVSWCLGKFEVCPDSSVVEHFHGKEGVVSSILTRGSALSPVHQAATGAAFG